jgi:hypothetical protein
MAAAPAGLWLVGLLLFLSGFLLARRPTDLRGTCQLPRAGGRTGTVNDCRPRARKLILVRQFPCISGHASEPTRRWSSMLSDTTSLLWATARQVSRACVAAR